MEDGGDLADARVIGMTRCAGTIQAGVEAGAHKVALIMTRLITITCVHSLDAVLSPCDNQSTCSSVCDILGRDDIGW